MTATSHAIVGAVIAAKIANPLLAIPVAIGSHILADMVPHWDTATHRHEKSKKDFWIHSIIDGALSLFIVYLLIEYLFPQTSLFYAYVIVFFSQFLDILQAPYLFLDIKYPFIYVYKFQKKFDRKLDKPWGIITQIVALLIIVIIALII